MGEEERETLKSLVFIYTMWLHHSAKRLHDGWMRDIILSDYRRPTLATLQKWEEEFAKEKYETN